MADEDPSLVDLDLEGKKKILIQTLKNAYKKDHIGTFPIPFIKKKIYSVNDVYVDGGIQLQNETSPGSKRRQSRLLASYKDLFRDSCLKHPNCIIKGEPGHGKSTLFLQCVYDWCHDTEDSPLNKFELLIFLRLRQLSGVRKISCAIKRFLLSKRTRFGTDDISNIIKKSSPLLVILDGYDEYPDRDLEISYEMKTIIHGIKAGTCLPQHTNIFLSGRYKPKTYDITNTTIVRLTGFDNATRIKYMQKSTSRDRKTSIEIHKKLTVNPLLDHICRTPLFFSMFAHMTYEEDDFKKWTSITNFFRYIIKCFHSHLRNKEENVNVQADSRTYDIEHSALNNLAMNGLIERKHAWKKSKIVEELGESFCNHYIKIGILREQVHMAGGEDEVKDKCEVNTDNTEVYFLHIVICEWYAAISLSESISQGKGTEVLQLLNKLNPYDVHYVYRFACGINPTVATTLIPHVKNFSNELQIACILELRDSKDAARKSLRQFFETTLEIKGNENGITRACKIELVRLASNHEIPIHTLRLNDWDYHVKPSKIQLEENVFLSHLPTVTELQVIVTDLINMTLEEFEHLMEYASQCAVMKQLVIWGFILPMYIPAKSIPEKLKTEKVIVRWNVRNLKVYHILNMDKGMWQNGITNETLNRTDYAAMTNFIQNF